MKGHLIAFDFDQTIADTSIPSPSGMNVDRAYNLALEEVFDTKDALVYFEDENGFANQEPSEMVSTMMAFAKKNGMPIRQYDSVQEAAQRLVDAKLGHLLKDINPQWPPLYAGASEFFQYALSNDSPVDVAIVSSGHDEFIRRVFQMNDLPVPTNLVTSDTIRWLKYPKGEKYKPYPYQLAKAHKDWRQKNWREEINTLSGNYLDRERVGKANMLYIGNDPIKDGNLAGNGRVIYGHMPFTHPNLTLNRELGQIALTGFPHLLGTLQRNEDALRKGKSFAEILLGHVDSEVFPPVHEQARPYNLYLEKTRQQPGRREAF